MKSLYEIMLANRAVAQAALDDARKTAAETLDEAALARFVRIQQALVEQDALIANFTGGAK